MQEASPTITVVDDDPSVRKALSRLLKAAGYSTTAYESAEDFLKSESVGKSACLILDVHLPGMNGLELQRAIVQTNSQCPIVFITAFIDEKARTRAIQSGATEFLRKPIDSDRLITAISKAIEGV